MERQKLDKTLSLPTRINEQSFLLHPDCEQQKVDVSEVRTNKPLNMMFVIDRTGSMQENINVIKSGVLGLSSQLEQQFWDVQFAAVGFRDYINDFFITPFVDAPNLEQYLAKWKAEGGEDPQEAGLEAIVVAADLLKNYIKKRPDRRDAVNIIVYVSDGPAYMGQDHNDFSTNSLISQAKSWLHNDKLDLRFYYAVPETTNAEDDLPKPLTQMQDFASQSQLAGKSLPFPLTLDIFSEFSKEFMQVTFIEEQLCKLQNATFESTSPQGIPSRDHRENIYEEANLKKPITFKISPDPQVTSYTLTIKRCCHSLQNMECSSIEETKFNFTLR